MFGSIKDTITLNNGIEMPRLGLGCYKSKGTEGYNAVRWALEADYSMIDTAVRYENEAEVGRAVRDSGKKREDIFIVSKLWPTQFSNPERGIDYSLHKLNMDYMDLYLLHWPGTNETARLHAWEALLNAQEKKKIRAAGVSNFTIAQIQQLIDQFGIIPAVNQVELHPWYPQEEMRAFCTQRNIALEAWGPIFRGHIGEVPLMADLGKQYGKSPVQTAIRWHIQKGNIVIPKSVNQARIQQNCNIFDFALSPDDMQKINALACGRHFGIDAETYSGDDFTVSYKN